MIGQKLQVLALPHVGISGGAGLYNRAAIAALARSARVTLVGDAAHAYAAPDLAVASVPAPPRPILPAYSGAKLRAFLFHAAMAPLRILRLLVWLHRHRATWATQDAVIATSSIDLLTLCAFGAVDARPRRICIVQENARLTGARGWLNRTMLKRMSDVVSISPSWSAQAQRHRINSTLAVNPFDTPLQPASVDPGGPVDLLFMGGSERIKGIDLFLALVERLARERPIHAVLLGAVVGPRAGEVDALRVRLAAAGSSLDVAGFVTDTGAFLERSRLLLLPITAPHFCRPAVEAGLRGRTFVISRLAGLEDFARDGENCIMARAGDVDDWARVVSRLLDDAGERRCLAAANRDWSMTSFAPATFDIAYSRLLAGC